MRADERLQLAQRSYQRAIAGARSASTPATWRRLLTALRNLKSARRERAEERDRARSAHAGSAPRARAIVAQVSAGTRSLGAAQVPWLELVLEWQRSKELMRRARELVDASRALRASLGHDGATLRAPGPPQAGRP